MSQVTDRFGADSLPLEVPQNKEVVADKFLYYATSYFQAFVNAKARDAWQHVQPGKMPIQKTFAHDPEQVVFNAETLPALFMWRGESGSGGQFGQSQAFEWIAEDYLMSIDSVRVLWVFPYAEQNIRRIRESIVNGLNKAIAVSFEFGRDPSWVVPGDPDPQASTNGSVFVRWAGVTRLAFSRWERKAITIRVEANAKAFECFEARLVLQELYTQDVTRYPAMGAGSLDQKLYDGSNTLLLDERII